MLMVKVKDRKKPNNEPRLVTQKAYAALGPKVYEKLGLVEVDVNGNEVGDAQSPNQNTAQVSRSVKGAAPVVVRTQIVTPKLPEEVVLGSGVVTDPVLTDTTELTPPPSDPPVQIKKKPGPKPKSISSPTEEVK